MRHMMLTTVGLILMMLGLVHLVREDRMKGVIGVAGACFLVAFVISGKFQVSRHAPTPAYVRERNTYEFPRWKELLPPEIIRLMEHAVEGDFR